MKRWIAGGLLLPRCAPRNNKTGEHRFMKLLFASDIHGSAYWCRRLMDCIAAEAPDKVVLLGDLLYHGPRNDLPRDYAPKEVLALLNSIREQIIAVRGNCDSEVDQMVLEFPLMADYFPLLLEDGRLLYVTHGHLWNTDNPPPLRPGDLLMNGHFHLNADRQEAGYRYLNPGSVSLPKDGQPNSYMVYQDGEFLLKLL